MKGLDIFRGYFAGHADQFVLIGGTAATLAMEDAGLAFRATKDLDIVLHIEALNASFGEVFWKFVEEGGYEIRQASNTGKPVFYRFQKPANERFPVMLELFCRAPYGIKRAEGSHLTPIPLDEAVASLSAILLDDDYYAFIMAGRKESDGLPWVGEDRLIPLKAGAWLDLNARRARGEPVDMKNIRKHANDVIRLSQLLAPKVRIPLAARIGDDLNRFLDGLMADRLIDPKSLNLNSTIAEIVQRIALSYELERARAQ
ncbi:MAG: nucleotidyl transferase AbiEii/AbiGii toxin family protein [Acidiferrobacteraceae bacterium]